MYQRHALSAAVFSLMLDRSACGGGSNTGQNLRVVVADVLTTTVDGTINHSDITKPAPPVSTAAYSNNFVGTATTGLFDVEGTHGTLAQQGSATVSPNTGTLFDNGPLFASGLPFTGGMDIVGGTTGPSNIIDLVIQY